LKAEAEQAELGAGMRSGQAKHAERRRGRVWSSEAPIGPVREECGWAASGGPRWSRLG